MRNRSSSTRSFAIASFVLALGLFVASVGAAESAGGVVGREVTALMGVLETSGCEFERNGSWYDGKRAASHLRRKYEHVRKRTTLPDTETFIELAASRSSVSGKPYRVRCGDAAPMESQAWFLARLALLRGATGNPSTTKKP